MENKIGINESLDVIRFFDAVVNEIIRAKQNDGKIETQEIIQALLASAPAGVQAAWQSWLITKELGELSPEEKQQLIDAAFPIILKAVQIFIPIKA